MSGCMPWGIREPTDWMPRICSRQRHAAPNAARQPPNSAVAGRGPYADAASTAVANIRRPSHNTARSAGGFPGEGQGFGFEIGHIDLR